MSNGYGLIPYGVGFYGLPHQAIPPDNALVSIINVQPTPGSFNIDRQQTFKFTIKTKFALNPNTTYVYLDNKLVINGAYFNTVDFTIIVDTNIDGISKDYTIRPNYLFRNRDVFTLQISATDIYGNPSPAFWAGYIVIDSRPPLLTPIYPLDGYVDVPIDLTIHFLINQLAAPDSGLDSTTLTIYVNDIPAVINGIIQSYFYGEYSAINIPTNIIDPIEVILDYDAQYSPNDIVTISVSIKEKGIIPATGLHGKIASQTGVIAAQETVINNVAEIGNGEYRLDYAALISTYLINSSVIADGYNVIDTNGNSFPIEIIGPQNLIVKSSIALRTSKYSFVTQGYAENPVTPVFAGYFQGIYLVDNLGDGYHINTTWHPARTTRPDYDLAYLIYYSTTRSDVFFEEPKLITQGRKLPPPETIHGADSQLFGYFAEIVLPVGVTYYFGVRATEYPHTTLPLIPSDGYGSLSAGLIAVDGYSFAIPAIQTVTSTISGIGAIVIPVTNTMGYAASGGYIVVGIEIMRYTALTRTTFIVASTGRGMFGRVIQPSHIAGEIVKMYYGNHDDNTVISKNLVSWESPFDPHRTRPDLVTTDFSLEDGYNAGFDPFDYCGYHRARPDELFSDTSCNGSYVGGEFNGQRGLLLYDRLLANEEQLLEVTGEPTILLKRIWSGETCICRTSRKDSAKVRSCSNCFPAGTLVRTIDGMRPIEQIKIGDKVLSSDGTFKNVTNTFMRNYSGKLKSIYSTTTTNPILATPEHPFFTLDSTHGLKRNCGPKCNSFIENGDGNWFIPTITLRPNNKWQARTTIHGNRKHIGMFNTQQEAIDAVIIEKTKHFEPVHKMDWKDAEEIKQNDWLTSIWNKNIIDMETVEIPEEFSITKKKGSLRQGAKKFNVDEEFLWIIGIYLAEGNIGTRQINFSLHKNEVKFQERIKKYFEAHGFGVKIKFSSGNGCVVRIHSSSLSTWFESLFGRKCYTKQIPEMFMSLPNNKLFSLLLGIYDGDGNKKEHEITQTSEVLALQLTEILHRCGKQPMISRQISKALTPKGNKRKIAYRVNWEEDVAVHHNRKGRWDFSGNLLTKVKTIDEVDFDGYVYNLEVDGDHTYIVQNILVHNCFGTGFKGGYVQYMNPRRDDRRIMVHFAPSDEELGMGPSSGWDQKFMPNTWTLAVPSVKDRDILLRFDVYGQLDWIYVVDAVSRGKTILGDAARQRLRVSRTDKTEPIYQYKYVK